MKTSQTTFKFWELRFLHAEGFSLEWLKPRSKAPVRKGWTKAPRQDFDTFKKAYRKGYNVGVRLGSQSKVEGGYLAVIDVDVKGTEAKHQREARAKLFELFPKAKTAPCVLSGRGNGSAHYYVGLEAPVTGGECKAKSADVVRVKMPSVEPSKREREHFTATELANGWRLRPAWEISLLCEGRQVVYPGSVHPDTGEIYEWAEGRALGEVEIPLISATAAPSAALERPAPRASMAFTEVSLDGLGLRPDQVAAVKSGVGVTDRSATVFALTMALLQRGVSEAEILSVFTDRRFYLGQVAFDHAKTDNREKAALWLQRYTLPKAKAQTIESAFAPSVNEEAAEGGPKDQGKPSRPEPLTIKHFNELNPPLESPLTLVEGVLAHGGFSDVIGQPGVGKSHFAINLAYRIATGHAFFGKPTEQCPVLYFAAESPRSIEQRFLAYRKAQGETDVPLGIVPNTISLLADGERIIEAVKRHGARFIVVDTLSRASAGFDENSAQEMSALIKILDRIREATGVHILIVHHAGKDPSKGARGSNALLGAVDTEILVESKGEIFTARITKQRDGETGEKFSFDLMPVVIGTDDFGDKISIPVVRELQNVREVKPLKGHAKTAMEVLWELSEQGNTITKTAWQEAFLTRTKRGARGQSKMSALKAFRRAWDILETNEFFQENGQKIEVLEVRT